MDYVEPKQNRNPDRRKALRGKELRIALRRVEWLAGAPLWQGDRVVWETSSGTFAPAPVDLARAHFRLRQIEDNPAKARRLLEDSDAWLARQWERFRCAERLALLRESDMSMMAIRCGEGDHDAENRCIALLEAEALCINGLPISPVRALSIPARGRAERLMTAIPSLSPIAGNLAAMALHRLYHGECLPHYYGVTSIVDISLPERLPDRPDIIAAMVAAKADATIIRRWLDLPREGHFVFDPSEAKRLLLQGSQPEDIVSIGESLDRFGKIVHDALAYRHRLPEIKPKERAARAADGRQVRQEAMTALGQIAQMIAADGRPQTVALMASYASATAELLSPYGSWQAVIADPLSTSLEMSASQRLIYLRLLNETQDSIWDRNESEEAWKSYCGRPHLGWLTRRMHCFQGLARLAVRTNDYDTSLALYNAGYRNHSDIPKWDAPRLRMLAQVATLCSNGESAPDLAKAVDVVDRFGATPSSAGIVNLLRYASGEPGHGAILLGHICSWTPEVAKVCLLRETLLKVLRSNARNITTGSIFSQTLHSLHFLLPLNLSQPALESIIETIRQVDDQTDDRAWCDINAVAGLTAICHGSDEAAVFRYLALELSGGDLSRCKQTLPLLRRLPALAHAIGFALISEPKRCTRLLRQLSMLIRFGPHSVDAFVKGWISLGDAKDVLIKIEADAAWYRLFRSVPDLLSEATTLMVAIEMTSGSQYSTLNARVPTVLRKRLEEDTRISYEMQYLETEMNSGRANAEQERRAEKLRMIISGQRIGQDVSRQIRDRLPRLAAQAVLTAAERQLQRVLWQRLEALAGPISEAPAIGEDLLNGVLLAGQIHTNRKALLALIRATVDGDTDWVRTRPQNMEFIESLHKRGINTTCWLAANPQTFPCQGVSGNRVHVYIENDPLRILPMGTYFGTCLSIDDCNAFTVVTNAVELNKRVIYARDMSGRVIGRKLLGIREDGCLLGFYTYASASTTETYDALQKIIDDYARNFAQRCNLTLAEDGDVPTLFCDNWYNAGTCPWADSNQRNQVEVHDAAEQVNVDENLLADWEELERRIAGYPH